MSAQDKIQAFAVTFRPKHGVTVEHRNEIIKLISNISKYYYIVSEKKDEECHIHAGVITNVPCTITNFNQKWSRKFRHAVEDTGSIWSVCYVSKPMYSKKWINEYLKKDEDGTTEVVASNMPSHSIEEYFAPKPVARAKKKFIADPFIQRLADKWDKYQPAGVDVNHTNVSNFLANLMFVRREIRGIMCPRKMKNTTRYLTMYIRRSPTYEYHSGVTLEDFHYP